MNFRSFFLAGLFLGFIIVAINIVAFSRASMEFDNALAIERVIDRFAYGLSKLTTATSNFAIFPTDQHEREWREARTKLQSFLAEKAKLFHRAGISLDTLEASLERLSVTYEDLVSLRSGPSINTGVSAAVSDAEKHIIVRLLTTHSELDNEAFSFDKHAELITGQALHNHFFTFIAVYASFVVFIVMGIFILYTFVFEPLRSLDLAIENVNQGDLSYRIKNTNPIGFGRVCRAFNDMLDHREKTERDLEEHAQMLAQSNAELESFAYIASHDLKAPLRGITNLVEWISVDLQGITGETTVRHLDLLKSRAARMDALLDGLLKYSRAGRIKSTDATVNVSHVVQQIMADFGTQHAFAIREGKGLPVFRTKLIPLEQVFRNLISNAIKHHDQKTGSITIEAEESGKFYQFSITDDGPGIPLRFHEKIFAMFQTLRPRDEVEGSGLGLALVKKVVEHHGGTISVESDPDTKRGTTFRFTWPRTEEADTQ